MTTLCADIVKSTGLPCCRPVIDFTEHCGYHAVNKKTRTRRSPRMLEECAICYTNMLHTQPRQACGHRFHDRCIVRWFQTGHNTCPLCRMVLDEEPLSDHEEDPTYIPTPPSFMNVDYLHTVESVVDNSGTRDNPIVIGDQTTPIYTPTTPDHFQPRYTPVSPQFHVPQQLPIVRRLVFVD